ncbi:MFS transporter [Nocardia altamirensis]|uniref:MFS transporter n=1 Tax=Nocardia altamirensis TaxID=472158 RepID=UPI0008401915|nr:MFS transporter [Nocardia altamirensis]
MNSYKEAVATVFSLRTWAQLGLLAFATFMYVTFELYPVGIIPTIAADLQVSESKIGLLVSGYAIVAAAATFPAVALASRISRKQAMLLALGFLIASEFLAAVAIDYNQMVGSRVLAAATHGLFWSLVIPVATATIPRERIGLATSIVFAGVSLATIVGVPASTALSNMVGWHTTAVILAIGTIATTVGLYFSLPGDIRDGADDVDATVRAQDCRSDVRYQWVRAGIICFFTLTLVAAHFVAYTYFSLIVFRVVGNADSVAIFLAIFGIAGAAATVLFGRYNDASPQGSAFAMVGVYCLAALGLLLGWLDLPLMVRYAMLTLAMIAWGGATAAVAPIFQSAIIRSAKDVQERASAVYVTCFQIGIAAGSAIGAAIVGASLFWLPMVMLVVSACTLAGIMRFRHAYA